MLPSLFEIIVFSQPQQINSFTKSFSSLFIFLSLSLFCYISKKYLKILSFATYECCYPCLKWLFKQPNKYHLSPNISLFKALSLFSISISSLSFSYVLFYSSFLSIYSSFSIFLILIVSCALFILLVKTYLKLMSFATYECCHPSST